MNKNHWSSDKLYSNIQMEVDSALRSDKQHGPEFLSLDHTAKLVMSSLAEPMPAIQVHGWDIFNKITGGLRSGEFSILCGPTGSGKTQWTADLSARLVINGVKHFVASVETGHVDFIARMFSALNKKDYNSGEPFSLEEIESLKADYAPIIKSQLIELTSYSGKVDPNQMMCDLFYATSTLKCKVAILDNLNYFLPFMDAGSENVGMDKVIHNFIVLCKSLNTHVIMVMHPKKTENGRVNHEFDIKGSSGAVQEAHNIFLFNRPGEDLVEDGYSYADCREIKFAKIRRRGRGVGKRIVYKAVNCSFAESELK